MSTIGGRIAELLQQTKYTQKELAGMVGVTEAAMTRYIKNERVPKADVIANLATALNTTSDYLIKGVDDTKHFSEIQRMVARNASGMTDEQKLELIRIIMSV